MDAADGQRVSKAPLLFSRHCQEEKGNVTTSFQYLLPGFQFSSLHFLVYRQIKNSEEMKT